MIMQIGSPIGLMLYFHSINVLWRKRRWWLSFWNTEKGDSGFALFLGKLKYSILDRFFGTGLGGKLMQKVYWIDKEHFHAGIISFPDSLDTYL